VGIDPDLALRGEVDERGLGEVGTVGRRGRRWWRRLPRSWGPRDRRGRSGRDRREGGKDEEGSNSHPAMLPGRWRGSGVENRASWSRLITFGEVGPDRPESTDHGSIRSSERASPRCRPTTASPRLSGRSNPRSSVEPPSWPAWPRLRSIPWPRWDERRVAGRRRCSSGAGGRARTRSTRSWSRRSRPLRWCFTAASPDFEPAWLAALWLAITDRREVLWPRHRARRPSSAPTWPWRSTPRKLVVTDAAGGWGRPPRSFAGRGHHRVRVRAAARRSPGRRRGRRPARGAGRRGHQREPVPGRGSRRELFTFDGAGTLFTSGGYVELGPLRVDDLPAVERLVAQGTADGLLRPRTRLEVAGLAVAGSGPGWWGAGTWRGS